MVTFAAQRSKQFSNVSPSVSSNHEARFSLRLLLTRYRVKIRAASSALKTERERDVHLLYMVYVAMWNEPATANWAHFAPKLASLRGEPITTFLLQTRAKITEIPPSSHEHGQEAVRKMSTL